jgi:hypothetical protein
MTWQENAIVYFKDGVTWQKISDHNRQPLAIAVERFESKNRMVDATLRRYTIAKKKTFQFSWTTFPSLAVPGGVGLGTVDGGWGGSEIEDFHNRTNGAFLMRLRKGKDEAKVITDGTIEEYTVMITDFSKDIEKRGKLVDLWSLSLTLEEV